jgi:uncharacterized repeat protein (TIGR01451 family)
LTDGTNFATVLLVNFHIRAHFRRWFVAAGIGLGLLSAVVFSAGAAGSDRQVLRGHVPPVVAHLTPQGLLPATNELHLAISLPLRNEDGLNKLLREIYDPASTNYHRYLTPEQFTQQFGPTEQDYQTVINFARTNGLTVTATFPNRALVDVSGSVASVENAFQIKLHVYRHPKENRNFFAPDTEPSTVAGIPISHVSGLENFIIPHPANIKKNLPAGKPSGVTPASGSGPSGLYQGKDFRAAYVPGTPLNGAGQTVGLFELDGYNLSDITKYEAAAGLPNVPLNNVYIDGFGGSAGANNVEVALDIDMAIVMATNLSQVIVYEAQNNGFTPIDVLNRIVTDNLAKQISSSWLIGNNSSYDTAYKQMAAQGQSFFQASGDDGAFYPGIGQSADDTNITLVGGTTLYTTGPGGALMSESAWNWRITDLPNTNSTGGGISLNNISIPVWQTGISMAGNQGSTTLRNIPDVALTADGIYIIADNGISYSIGGTSAAAPLWAGYTALINQQAVLSGNPTVGFLNPAIYAIGKGTNYALDFHDVTAGNNTNAAVANKYFAVAGYDLCTGWGTPNGTNLINALAPLTYFTSITNAGWSLQSESGAPPNGAVDPGETVTVNFTLKNQGTLAPGNLVATLQPNVGVLAPSGPQSYGTVAAFGGLTNRPFTFTTAGTCGSNIVAALQLQDGTNNLGTVNFTLPLGGVTTNSVQSLAQNFDSVTTPALPSGWTSATLSGTINNWVTTAASSDTPPNSIFISDIASSSANALVSPVIAITSASAHLTFRHNYSFDYHSGSSHAYRDGGVLEVKIGNGTFSDILAAGGSFVAGGYNNKINTVNNNPLNGRSAWVGIFNTWQTVTVNLPASAAGQNIQLRWNCGTDSSNTGTGTGAVGWYVDSISITDSIVTANCAPVFTDLAVGQSLATGSQNAGQNLVYTLTVTNVGSQTAANVTVTDSVPAQTTFVSASPGYSISAGRVVWSAGTLPVAAATNFTLTLSPAGGNGFTNIVGVGTVTPETTTANNTSTLVSTQAISVSAGINIGPTGQSVQCGGNASFSVIAAGTAPLSIQWSLDGLLVPGATNSNFTLINLHQPNHTVAVTVTNLYGGATSNAMITVFDSIPPVITLNGGNPVIVEVGGAFTDPGATANDLCAGGVPITITGSVNTGSVGTNTLIYTASDGNGNTNTATRTVIVRDTTTPAISWSFTNLVMAADTNCSGIMPNVTGTNYILATDLSGALTISQIPTNNFILPLGTNAVVISVADASGNIAFSTNTIVIQDGAPPQILSQPQNQTNLVGTAASFSATAIACTPLAFQWFMNSTALSNQTNSTLTLASVNLTNVGNYSVSVTASGGSTNSTIATLTVFDPAPVIAGVAANTDGSITLKLAGAPGSTYVLEATTNLAPIVVWLPIATNQLDASGLWHFTDPQAVNFEQQFYRLELAP